MKIRYSFTALAFCVFSGAVQGHDDSLSSSPVPARHLSIRISGPPLYVECRDNRYDCDTCHCDGLFPGADPDDCEDEDCYRIADCKCRSGRPPTPVSDSDSDSDSDSGSVSDSDSDSTPSPNATPDPTPSPSPGPGEDEDESVAIDSFRCENRRGKKCDGPADCGDMRAHPDFRRDLCGLACKLVANTRLQLHFCLPITEKRSAAAVLVGRRGDLCLDEGGNLDLKKCGLDDDDGRR